MSQQSNSQQAKPTTAKKQGFLPQIVIPILLLIGIGFYMFVCGNGANFEGGSNANHPLPGNYLGMIYKGGFIVPLLFTLFLTVLVFSIERFLTINKASGNGSIDDFVRKVKYCLETNDVDGAISACDKQQGSVANVVRASLEKYKQMQTDTSMDKEQKVLAIRKEIEEATSLELPMLEKNLSILATIAPVGTLVALLGTVLGMIRAFSALGASGQTDATALSQGISEALINTALGIGTSALAIVMYNIFTTKIDKLTYGIDEAGFSIAETFNSKHK